MLYAATRSAVAVATGGETWLGDHRGAGSAPLGKGGNGIRPGAAHAAASKTNHDHLCTMRCLHTQFVI
jgi:hypothetical protein